MIECLDKLEVMVTFLFAKVISLYVMEVESRQGIHLWFHFNLDDAIYENVEQCFSLFNSKLRIKVRFK